MMMKLNGPDLDSFDAQTAVSQWWKAGCHPAGQPYGPRARPESDTDSSTSESDSESDLD